MSIRIGKKEIKIWDKKYIISILLLLLFLKLSKAPLNMIPKASPSMLLLSSLLLFLGFLAHSVANHFLLHRMYGKGNIIRTTAISYIGMTLNEFLPKGSGDVIKAYILARKYKIREKGGVIAYLDKFINALALVFVGFLGLLLTQIKTTKEIAYILLVFLLLMLPISLITLQTSWINSTLNYIIKKITKKEPNININYGNFSFSLALLVFSLYTLSTLLQVAGFYYLFISLGSKASYFSLCVLFVITILITYISMLPGGLGIREGAFTYFASLLLLPVSTSAVVIILFRILNVFLFGVGGAVAYWIIEKE